MKKHIFLSVMLIVSMILIVAACGAAILVSGCAGKNLGDGRVDQVETATIRLAVGAAMGAMPETVIPAYAVTKALLAVMDGPDAVPLNALDAEMERQVKALNLTPLEKQSMADLVDVVRANIEARISGMDPDMKLVMVRSVIEIVHDAAAARLNLAKAEQ